MSDYSALIELLRECGHPTYSTCLKCGAASAGFCSKAQAARMRDAADAIEELLAERNQLRAQMPKRGHNTNEERIFSCSECGYGIYDIFLNDERNYSMEPNYCPHCGAKMEVGE